MDLKRKEKIEKAVQVFLTFLMVFLLYVYALIRSSALKEILKLIKEKTFWNFLPFFFVLLFILFIFLGAISSFTLEPKPTFQEIKMVFKGWRGFILVLLLIVNLWLIFCISFELIFK